MTTKVTKTRELMTAPKDGDIGPMGIPAGSYDSNTLYTRTASICPVVEHNSEYWYPAAVGTLRGSEPSASNPAWKKAENFEVMFVKILFAQFAKLGEAIFHGRYMFSQQGIKNGAASSDYQYFNPNDPDNEASAQRFAPNLYLDFLTGAARLAKGKAKFKANGEVEITGTIHATDGEFEGKLQSKNFYHHRVNMAASGTVDASADIVFIKANNLRITLPTGSAVTGKIIEIYGNSGSAVITNTLYTGSIGTEYTVRIGDLYRVFYDGSKWFLLSTEFLNPNHFSATTLSADLLFVTPAEISSNKTLGDDYSFYIVRANVTITLPQIQYHRQYKILIAGDYRSVVLKAYSNGSAIQNYMIDIDGNQVTQMTLTRYRMYEVIGMGYDKWYVRVQ